MFLATAAVLASFALPVVMGHGYVPIIRVNGKEYKGWDVNSDPYATPAPVRAVRRTPSDSGFISDPASSDITCSIGNRYLPAGESIPVAAGGTVQVQWNTWPVGHYGPIMNYMANCNGACASWKGDSGSPWFKISQKAFTNNQWASDELATNGFKWDVKIPASLAPGNYLLRHENLALHGGSNIGGAQFYPVCIQLTVTGSGTKKPSGLNFPGAYSATDPGIHFNPYQGNTVNAAYVPPGGPVYAGL